jgi:ABC-type multidrug transport system ATPase subunit/ABC-type multidrug transport system permease subunit
VADILFPVVQLVSLAPADPASSHLHPSPQGPSGCGKTTLLDMLAGKKTYPYGGEVYLNGRARDRLYPRLTSYVAQDAILSPHCTVAEVVEFSLCLRVDMGSTSRETGSLLRRMYVDETLAMFGLIGVKDQLIGSERVRGISSGQKRRVSLARGFVGGAQVVFADEPTSGLSATDAELCVRAIYVASRKQGVTFVVVIHQPRVEVAAMFDHLTLITSDPGRVVYNGPFCDVAGYFEAKGSPVPANCNPADFLLDAITPGVRGNRADELAVAYADRENGQVLEVEARVEAMIAAGGKAPLDVLRDHQERREALGLFETTTVKDSVHSVPQLTQIATLLKRRLTLTLRDKSLLRTRYGMALIQGLIVGIAFQDIGRTLPVQQVSFLFMLLQIGALSNMVIMPEMIAQRMEFKFEISDALYSTTAAVLVDTVVNNTLAIIGNFITSVMIFAFSGFEWSNFGILYFWSFMSFMTMTNFFKVVAAVTPTPANALQVAMPGLMLMILFNNFFVTKATAPPYMKWAIYISPMAWAIEQIITELHGNDQTLIELYGYDPSDAQSTRALAVLVAEIIVFQAVALVCLRQLNNIKR